MDRARRIDCPAARDMWPDFAVAEEFLRRETPLSAFAADAAMARQARLLGCRVEPGKDEVKKGR